MSAKQILSQIDDILNLLQRADCTESPVSQFLTEDDVNKGQMLRVTNDLELLTNAWKEAELVMIDELSVYLKAVGKVMDIEDDGTVQLRWANYDTSWIPIKACSDAGNADATVLPSNVSWLPPQPEQSQDTIAPTGKFLTCNDVEVGQMVQVTTLLEVLKKEWRASDLVIHDEIPAYLGSIGKIMEIEDDDDSVQLRWENYDTTWIPIKACSDAGNAKATVPNLHVSWLPPTAEKPKQNEQVSYIENENEIKEGDLVCITKNIDILNSEWKASELGPNDEKNVYLGNVGKIMEIEEDDETVKLRWENYDTVWIPYKACFVAPADANVTTPIVANSWLSN